MAGYGWHRDVVNDKLDTEVAGVKRTAIANGEARTRTTIGVTKGTRTDIDAQAAAPTVAQIKTGFVVHTSTSGASTLTSPTGALLDAGFPGMEVGDTIEYYYLNDGNQSITLTGASGTTALTAAVILTLEGRLIVHTKTATDTFDVFAL